MARYYIEPKAGDRIQADGWSLPELIFDDDITPGYKDSEWPGCQFRYESYRSGWHIAINVRVTGGPKWNGRCWKSRCKIEFVGDGEPSTFSGGYLFTDSY